MVNSESKKSVDIHCPNKIDSFGHFLEHLWGARCAWKEDAQIRPESALNLAIKESNFCELTCFGFMEPFTNHFQERNLESSTSSVVLEWLAPTTRWEGGREINK